MVRVAPSWIQKANISSLNPTSIAHGTPTKVTVHGTGFIDRSKVWADEEQQHTVHDSPTQLSYTAQADQAGSQSITVRNGNTVSNVIELTVT